MNLEDGPQTFVNAFAKLIAKLTESTITSAISTHHPSPDATQEEIARWVASYDPIEFAEQQCRKQFGKSLDELRSLEEYEAAHLAAGRNHGPALLENWLWGKNRLWDDKATLRALLPNIWSMVEWPLRALPTEDWVQIFTHAGFISDDGSAQPTQTLTLYRGAGQRQCRGMSWTRSLTMARWFAKRIVHRQPGFVWCANVPPQGVLAIFNKQRTGLPGQEGKGKGETEVVVNPALLPRPVRRVSP